MLFDQSKEQRFLRVGTSPVECESRGTKVGRNHRHAASTVNPTYPASIPLTAIRIP